MNRIVFVALALLAAPALADGADLNGMAEEVLASEWADPIYLDGDYLFEPIDFDDPSVQTSFLLDAHPFRGVESTFGGTPQVEEIFDNLPIRWLCYDTGHTRTTFASVRSEEAGNETMEPGPVIGLIIEEANAPQNAACIDNAAAASPQPGNDIPGLGAKIADLESRFGSAPVDEGGHIAYVAKAELGDAETWIETKIVYYRIEAGIVTGVAFKLTNTDVTISGD
jgi:hypothetical protein